MHSLTPGNEMEMIPQDVSLNCSVKATEIAIHLTTVSYQGGIKIY
jgi:hypothetical protein